MTTTSSSSTTSTSPPRPTILRTVLAGAFGGTVFNVVGFLTFVLLGSGLDNESGPLVDPDLQSAKMIAVWTTLEPLPKFHTQPGTILLIYVIFGIGYATLYRSVASAWPVGVWRRAWRLALAMWFGSCVFFELLGPFNLLGEPVLLVVLELAFWAVMAMAAAVTIVTVMARVEGPAG